MSVCPHPTLKDNIPHHKHFTASSHASKEANISWELDWIAPQTKSEVSLNGQWTATTELRMLGAWSPCTIHNALVIVANDCWYSSEVGHRFSQNIYKLPFKKQPLAFLRVSLDTMDTLLPCLECIWGGWGGGGVLWTRGTLPSWHILHSTLTSHTALVA